MPGTYKLITLVGTSRKSFAEAASSAIAEATRTVRNISWFEVDEMRGRVDKGRIAEFQVTLRAGFRVESGGGASSARSGKGRKKR